jgi:Zn-dependent peptidase ImmA (M78 family)
MSTTGDMLRLARQRLGFTQKQAAERLGVVQPVLSRVENDITEADSALLLKAAQVYKVPSAFFQMTDPVYGPPVSVHAMLRGKADLTGREIDMVTAELNIRLMHLRRFLQGLDFSPPAELPSLDVERYGSAEKIADAVRTHWQLPPGPVKNLTQLVERAGVVVGKSTFGGAAISGVTFRAPGMPPLVLLNSTHPADRLRFTLAHELGHLVMHRFPTPTMENEANQFAAALLMPERDVRPAFMAQRLDLARLAALKQEWRVAMQALLYRASETGFLKPNQSRYLWQQISAKGWKQHEPVELDFPPEQPRVLSDILKAQIADLGYSLADVVSLSRVHDQEFVEMYGAVQSDSQPPKPRLRIV